MPANIYDFNNILLFAKKIVILFFLMPVISSGQSGSSEHPSFSLNNIPFSFSLNNIPDSVNSVTVIFTDDNSRLKFDIPIENGTADTSISLSAAGSYKITYKGAFIPAGSIRIIPGWFSLVPPLLAILLALLIRQVLVALAAGIYIGAVFIYGYNPVIGLFRFADTIVLNALLDADHMMVIVFTLLIGGVVGIISRNGGTAGLANVITKLAHSSRSGMLSSWLMGLAVFFDDYANSLIIGNMMRPITDKLRISREKLAYIVDSTDAPVASIVIISTWIGYELGLIDEGLKAVGSTENAYDIFIRTIPYRFYPIAAIFFVFLTSVLRRDFGSMYKAEMRARIKGELYEKGTSVKELKDPEREFYSGSKAKWFNGLVPILIILFGTVAGLILTGINSLESNGIYSYSVRDIISASDSYSSLLWASFIACIAAIIMSVSQRILKLSEAVDAWSGGIQSMLFACIILVFAWSISTVTNELQTADYLISILSDSVNPRFLPVLVFIICAFTSFSTGTSWGTMAIVMPIVIPLGFKLSVGAGFSHAESSLIIQGVVSSVLAGSVFGDHCSPIADTTILSSMASKCNHIDHVKTQLPYALLVGIVCMLIGDIPTAYGFSPYISIPLIFIILTAFLLIFGKKVPESSESG